MSPLSSATNDCETSVQARSITAPTGHSGRPRSVSLPVYATRTVTSPPWAAVISPVQIMSIPSVFTAPKRTGNSRGPGAAIPGGVPADPAVRDRGDATARPAAKKAAATPAAVTSGRRGRGGCGAAGVTAFSVSVGVGRGGAGALDFRRGQTTDASSPAPHRFLTRHHPAAVARRAGTPGDLAGWRPPRDVLGRPLSSHIARRSSQRRLRDRTRMKLSRSRRGAGLGALLLAA